MVVEVVVGIFFLLMFLPLPVLLFLKGSKSMAELTWQRMKLSSLGEEIAESFPQSAPKLDNGELFSNQPKLEFSVMGYACRLFVRRDSSGKVFARSVLSLEDGGTTFTIAPVVQQISSGGVSGDEFSKQFCVRSSLSQEECERTVSSRFKDFLLTFSENRKSVVSLSCSSRRIVFEEVCAPQDLSWYVEVFSELAALAGGFSQEGFLLEMVSSAAEGKCPVCSTPIGSSRSVCDSCQTPHHPECWEYNEGCAVYACSCKSKRDIFPALE